MNQELQFMKEAENDNQWLQSHYEEIREEYPNKFVAIAQKKIIAVGEIMENVVESVKEKGINPAVILIEFIPERGLLLIL